MRDDNYISSRRDIRNKRRYRQRRRQVLLNRGIFVGILIIVALIATIIGVKSCRNNKNETKANAENTVYNSTNSSQQASSSSEQGGSSEDDKKEEETSDTKPSVSYKTDGVRIVCIDPGHGGVDGGSSSADGILEKDDNLKMAQALKKELEAKGVTVYMTRTDDSFLDLSERVEIANEKNADLLISIHRNSYKADVGVRGFETWVHSSQPAESVDAATKIQAALLEAGITRDRGVKFGSQGSDTEDYYINNHSAGPSCLLEMGFMTNENDNSVFRQSTEALAKAMANAIVEWLDAQGL